MRFYCNFALLQKSMRKKIIVLVCFGMLASCSTKKDSFKNRAFHNSTAWFNTLFNAEKEMDKKIKELEFNYTDNYSEILPVDPRPEVTDFSLSEEYIDQMAAGLSPGKNNQTKQVDGFDLVEQKALKAIEKHSMLINGVERNKTMTHAYLVLGKARYHKGKGFDALDALNYLQTKLPRHKKYTPEAQLYTALANIQVGNEFDGQRSLETLYKDDGYKKDFKEDIGKSYAQLLIDNENYEEALNLLNYTLKNTKNKKRKARYTFIEGQLYSRMGKQTEAGEAFTRVFNLKPGFEMEVKSQLGIAANFDPEINRYTSYRDHLLDISKKGNYLSRKNELLYAIGDIAIKADKKEEARKYLKESFVGPASDPYIRGKAYERYADLEFDEGNYVHASAYYDSAISVAPYDKDIARITERNSSLKHLMEKHYLVKRNDSILKLASMSPQEQESFFGNYISKLKIEDAKRKKQMEEEATVFQTQSKGGNFNTTFGETGGGSTFYFYNNTAKSSGQNEFKRVWGNIRLTDNWRSSAGASLSLEEQEAELLGQADAQNPRRYEMEYYIEQIPTRPSDLSKLKIERDTTELSLGIGYFDLFKNSKMANSTLEHLLLTPPKEQSTEAQAMYQLYRINSKIENTAKAEEYKNSILTKYPTSVYAMYILNPEVDYSTPTTKDALALYEETYDLYKNEKYKEVKENVSRALEMYPSEIIIAKFTLVNSLAIGKTEGREDFISALELITIAYQNTEEAKKAQEILDILNNVKKSKPSESSPTTDMEQIRKDEIKEKEAEMRRETNSNSNLGAPGRPDPKNQSERAPRKSKPSEGARDR